MVDLNITLWIQLANFLVTLVVLNYLLISPIRKIIRKRKDNVEGLIGEIEAFTAEKQQLLDEYESELRKAREAAAIYRKDGKVMGELERARIFDAASKDAQSEVRTTQAAVRFGRKCTNSPKPPWRSFWHNSEFGGPLESASLFFLVQRRYCGRGHPDSAGCRFPFQRSVQSVDQLAGPCRQRVRLLVHPVACRRESDC